MSESTHTVFSKPVNSKSLKLWLISLAASLSLPSEGPIPDLWRESMAISKPTPSSIRNQDTKGLLTTSLQRLQRVRSLEIPQQIKTRRMQGKLTKPRKSMGACKSAWNVSVSLNIYALQAASKSWFIHWSISQNTHRQGNQRYSTRRQALGYSMRSTTLHPVRMWLCTQHRFPFQASSNAS